MNPFDYIKSINETKINLISDDQTEKDYAPWIVNKGLSYFPDTIFYANEMNIRHGVDKKMQYDYLFYSIKKKKRFSKWHKKEELKNIALIKEYYDYNESNAKEALKLLSKDQIEYIKETLCKD